MRTTLAVDDHLLADSVGREPVEVPVFRGGGGPLPGVDLRSNRAIREVLGRGAETAELRRSCST